MCLVWICLWQLDFSSHYSQVASEVMSVGDEGHDSGSSSGMR